MKRPYTAFTTNIASEPYVFCEYRKICDSEKRTSKCYRLRDTCPLTLEEKSDLAAKLRAQENRWRHQTTNQ